MLMKQLTGGTVGGDINPTSKSQTTKTLGTTATFTVDLSKKYLLFCSYKYNDTTYRQEIQYIDNGTVTSLTNNSSYSWVNLGTISGTTLSVVLGSTGNNYVDFNLIQLD